jgi:hypothetical protein
MYASQVCTTAFCCCTIVGVATASQHLLALDRTRSAVRRRHGTPLAKPLMWPGIVVLLKLGRQHPPQMLRIADQ